jgi:hypothetical protein
MPPASRLAQYEMVSILALGATENAFFDFNTEGFLEPVFDSTQ